MHKIIFDLDHTLFATGKFRDDIFRILADVGVANDEVRESYLALLQQQGGNYDWRNHLQLLKKRGTCSEEQQDRAETLYQQIAFSSYILPGATETLLVLSQTFELWLITKGVPHMQHEKLSRANLQPFFDERIRIVTHDKIPAFEAIAAAGDIFINDHLEETRRITQSLPFLRALLFLRPDRDTLYDPSAVTEESFSEYHLLPALLI